MLPRFAHRVQSLVNAQVPQISDMQWETTVNPPHLIFTVRSDGVRQAVLRCLEQVQSFSISGCEVVFIVTGEDILQPTGINPVEGDVSEIVPVTKEDPPLQSGINLFEGDMSEMFEALPSVDVKADPAVEEASAA